MAIIKPRRGLSTALAGSGTNQYELKYTTDTKDLYIYDGSNVNITSKVPVVVSSAALSAGTTYTITNAYSFRFLNIYTSLSTRYDHYFRLPKVMYPSGGNSITYLVTFEHGGDIKYATITITFVNGVDLTVKHNYATSDITFKVVKEY